MLELDGDAYWMLAASPLAARRAGCARAAVLVLELDGDARWMLTPRSSLSFAGSSQLALPRISSCVQQCVRLLTGTGSPWAT